MILLTVLGWQAWSVYRSRNRTESHTFLIQQLSDRIVYFDEVLTMSANMAAATGESQWQKRYREAEPQLDSTIKQLRTRLLESFPAEAAAQTDAANVELVRMENRAFELVEEGDRGAAMVVLSSEDYRQQKQIYAEGMQRIHSALQEYIASEFQKNHRHAIFGVALAVVALPIAFLLWLGVIRTVRGHMAQRKDFEHAVESIVVGASAQFGEAFFEVMTKQLTAALNADYCFVGELAGPGRESVRTIVVCSSGRIVPNFEYNLVGTPCEKVIWKGVCSYLSHVAELFPEDAILKEIRAQAYVGVPLFDPHHESLGIMVVLFLRPLKDAAFAEAILQMFASRTAAEIVRTRAEEQLNLRDRAMANARNGILITEHKSVFDNPIVYANPAFEHITGYSFEEIAGRDCRFLQGDDRDQPELEQVRQAIREERNYQVVLRNYRKDGKMFYNQFSISPVRDSKGRVTHFVGIISDVSERIRAEKTLQESEQRFRAIVDYTCDWQEWAGPDGRVLWLNPAVERLTGYSCEECMAMGDYPAPIVHEDDRQRMVKVRDDAIKQRSSGNDYSFRIRRKGGSVRWVAVSWQPIYSQDTYLGIRASIRDMTERRHNEEVREQLAQMLEAKNKELQAFTRIVRHDFGNLLFSINAYSFELSRCADGLRQLLAEHELSGELKQQVSTILNRDVQQALGFIRQSTDEMQKLLDGLKHVAAVGRLSIKIEPQDIDEIIKRVTGKMKFQIDDTGVSVMVEPLPPCYGDATLLDQVFSNLFDNALKYLDPSRTGIIRIAGRTQADISIYSVQDNGIGIAPENQEKVFEIFQRIRSEGAPEGEGLGLSIVRRILDRHNGKIWLESEPGKGSTFYIALPKAPAKVPQV